MSLSFKLVGFAILYTIILLIKIFRNFKLFVLFIKITIQDVNPRTLKNYCSVEFLLTGSRAKICKWIDEDGLPFPIDYESDLKNCPQKYSFKRFYSTNLSISDLSDNIHFNCNR